MTKLTLLKKVA